MFIKSSFVSLALGLCTLTGQLAAANPFLQARAACNADNCARQVTGTSAARGFPSQAARQSDCQAFVAATTVVPGTVIATTTIVTLDQGSTPPSQTPIITTAQTIVGPQAQVPPYVNSCGTGSTLTSRYSSACSCFPGVTTPAPSPSPTITATAYVVGTCRNGFTYYNAYCDRQFSPTSAIYTTVQATSQDDCANKCLGDRGCTRANFVYDQLSASYGSCQFFATGQLNLVNAPGTVGILVYRN